MMKEVPIHRPLKCHHERLQLPQSEVIEAWMGDGEGILFRDKKKKREGAYVRESVGLEWTSSLSAIFQQIARVGRRLEGGVVWSWDQGAAAAAAGGLLQCQRYCSALRRAPASPGLSAPDRRDTIPVLACRFVCLAKTITTLGEITIRL